jgi:hypothetical protein
MTFDDIVAELDAIETRIDLIAFLAPLRVTRIRARKIDRCSDLGGLAVLERRELIAI